MEDFPVESYWGATRTVSGNEAGRSGRSGRARDKLLFLGMTYVLSLALPPTAGPFSGAGGDSGLADSWATVGREAGTLARSS